MGVIKIRQNGDFSKLTRYLNKAKKNATYQELDKYGRMGVEALSKATPIDSGTTANSWYYKIERKNGRVEIGFYNSNINENVPIAIILQYGHATNNGGWVEGVDYINPAIKPIFEDLANRAWVEVSKV